MCVGECNCLSSDLSGEAFDSRYPPDCFVLFRVSLLVCSFFFFLLSFLLFF